MKNWITLTLLLIISTSFFNSLKAQQDSTVFNKILQATHKFSEQYPLEKVYLHFDKPYYSVGDTIWFKGYITDGQNKLSPLSKVLYVEFFNRKDSLVQLLKLSVQNGTANGNLILDKDEFNQGNYYVRAYTLWMSNFDSNYFFFKNIAIGEAIDKELITHISFVNGGDQKINASILYSDLGRKPYVNKTVNWQIITNSDVVAKGKGTTDANGKLIIQIPKDSKKVPLETNSLLTTSLNAVNKEPSLNSTFGLSSTLLKNDFQMFPEGGAFIANIPLQIGFKAVKADGMGIALKGTLLDNENNTVTDFESKHAGMGSFYINMELNKTYKVRITYVDGTTDEINLPAAEPSGIAVQTNVKNPINIDVRITANDTFYNQHKNKSIFVIAQNNGFVYYAAKGILEKQTFAAKIPKDKLPDGIIQFAIFSEEGIPLSERLIFNKNKDKLNLTVKADKPSYGIKQKVNLTISAQDTTNAIYSALSLSVIDESKVPISEESERTILSTLLLTSDLQGYIEKPNYYFNSSNEIKVDELDYLMLTQGFRRFVYNDILQNNYPKINFLPEQGISISGTLRNKTGLPINKGTMSLTIPSKRFNKQLTTSALGEFSFDNLDFQDGSEVTASAKYNASPSSLMVMLNGMPEAAPGKNINIAEEIVNIDSALNNYLANSEKQYQSLRTIKEVVIAGAKVKKPSHDDYASLSNLPSVPDYLVSADQLGKCNTLAECLKSRLLGVTYDNDNFYISKDFMNGIKIPMAIFVNGLLIDYNGINLNSIAEFDSAEIFFKDEHEVVNRSNGTRGIIVLNMKSKPKGSKNKFTAGDLKNLIPESFNITYKPRGYSIVREYYVPKYSVDPASLNFTDRRTTVYWNPQLKLNKEGRVTIEFFNADGKGNYKAILEGIDSQGNISRTVFRYLVK